jgi:hypothetical protein
VFAALHHPPTSGYEIENQDHYRDYKQKVNQAAANVKAETEKPKNQHDYKYCPKHINLAPWHMYPRRAFSSRTRSHCIILECYVSSADEPIYAQAAIHARAYSFLKVE